MRIQSLTLAGFHCFGGEPTSVEFDDLTALIGSNGCGKSAALTALTRLFGTSQSVRQIRQSDFHLPVGKTYDDFEELVLSIEAVLSFPELDDESDSSVAVPECFNQMIIEEEGSTPFCRVRLTAKWFRTNLSDGEIEERIDWITAADGAESDDVKSMRPYERSRIHALYVPAIRDPVRQLRQASGTILSRLLRATNWSDDGKGSIEKAAASVSEAFRNEEAVSMIEVECAALWQQLQDFPDLENVQLRPLETKLSELIRHLEVRFADNAENSSLDVDRLSDGLRSLFYLSLIVGAFHIEQAVTSENPKEEEDDDDEENDDPPFLRDALDPPMLTVFAIEEPENHLAAHYLGRVLNLLRELSKEPRGQVIVTSHSPAILGRVDPVNVRHLRLDADRQAQVRRIRLPTSTSEAFKYVKEAVLAYPELYFARLVVLGEGDSEEIVLRRFASIFGHEADAKAISVVPLGGRHVNHFWKLLRSLDIPHVTLLDLDRERDGGGWGRIEYACKQLQKNGIAKKDLFTVEQAGKSQVLSDEEIDEIHTWSIANVASMQTWISDLAKHSVYFCDPLDLDFAMLSAYPDEYKATGIRGPKIPKQGTPEYEQRLASALTATLKGNNAGGKTFSSDERELFIWYAYLFLGNGKPTTHLLALGVIDDKDLKKRCPEPIRLLFKDITEKLKPAR